MSISVFGVVCCVLLYSCVATTPGNLCTNTVGIKCSCTYSRSGELSVDCTVRSLTFIPTGIQQDAITVDFSDNSITSVELDDFIGLERLETLYLKQNLISAIVPGAFDKLYSLQTLSLQGNKLTVVQSGYFHHMPSLVLLDLSLNEITTFARDSILYLPKLGQLAINSNPLNCDCEMRAFRQSIYARQGNLLVLSATCAGTTIKMTDAPDSQFGSCTGDQLFKSISCMNCKNVRSARECIAKNETVTCLTSHFAKPVCMEEMNYVPSGLMINKGCRTYAPCLESETVNANQCYGQPNSVRCVFCCAGEYCNKYALRGRQHSSTYLVAIEVDKDIPNNLLTTGTAIYTYFEVAVKTQVINVLNNKPTSYGSFIPYSVTVGAPRFTTRMRVEFNTVSEVNSNTRASYIKKQIQTIIYLYTADYPIQKVTVTLIGSSPCPSDVTTNDKGQFQWGSVYPGEVSYTTCPNQNTPGTSASRACVVDSTGSSLWDTPDTSACQYTSTTTQSLNNLANTQVNSNNADNVRTELLQISKDSATYSDVDVKLSVDVVEDLLAEGSVYSNNQKGQEMVETMSNILNSPEEAISQSENTYRSSERFVKAVDNMANGIVPSSDEFSAVNDNLALLVKKTDPNNFNGITMDVTSKSGSKLNANQINIKDGEDTSAMVSGVVVPSTLFDTAGKTSPRVSFAVYGTDKMFKSVNTNSLGSTTLVVSKDIKGISQVNGPVISTSVQNTIVDGLVRPILFRFEHLNDHSERPQCVFVRTTGSTGMEWSNQGCKVKEHVTGSHTDCECNHMTNFALLMDIYQTGGQLSEANRLALTYISYIGCGVSLFGLLFTLLTYFMFRKLRVNNPSKILINLCLALAVVNVIFLVGMQEYTLESHIGCKIVAVSLHYMLLSAMSWMLVEAFYMYLALIKVFNTHFSHFLLKCCLFGWGVPLVIVGVTLGINKTDSYGQQAGGICWLSPIPFYAAFLAPVGIILILNFITFVLVFKTLLKGSSTSKKLTKSDNKNSIAQRLRGAITLIVLLGLTWAFAIFAIGNGGIIFQYLFTIFNSLQGLFICIFYCVLKTDAQQAWKKKLGCGKPTYSGPSTTKEKTVDRTRDTGNSNTYTSEVSNNKKDFTDLSKEIEANYPGTRTKPKASAKRYPSYSESNT